MSDEEAAAYAYKRERTKKFVVAAGALTLAAASAYVAYKHYDKNVDKFLEKGDILKRITSSDTTDLHDVYYAAKSNRDAKRYVGFYGQAKLKSTGQAFQKSIDVNDRIKIASEKSATNVLKELANNDTYRVELRDQIKNMRGVTPKQVKTIAKARQSLDKGIIDDNVYKAFNVGLVTNRTSNTVRNFYDAMKKHGYGAIGDVNDRELSGYNTKTATIVFDTGKTVVSNVKRLHVNEVCKQNRVEVGKDVAKNLIKDLAKIGVVGGTIGAIIKANETKQQDQIIDKYRKEHPDTKMTYNEILKTQLKKE